jgi:hypothetical protein
VSVHWPRRLWLEWHDREAGDQPEVPHVGSQQGVANFKRRCSDQQIAERDDDSLTLLFAVDLACQQRRLFGVGIDFHVVEQFTDERVAAAAFLC